MFNALFNKEEQEDLRPNQWKYNDEGIPTETSINQDEVLKLIYPYFYGTTQDNNKPFIRTEHLRYLLRGLNKLASGFAALDASQPWILFWIVQGLSLLNYDLTDNMKYRIIDRISRMQNPNGGFGGGNGQVSHLAATYAAIHTLLLIGNEEAYSVINREALYNWFLSLKQEDGSFLMCQGGEIDIRGSYCVVTSAAILNILTDELAYKVDDFILRCQGFDGGLGCYPGVESHGGYTFCGLAALELLDSTFKLNLDRLTKWCVDRQMDPEGGFQGRTNKLVDGCYSFWVGATFPILSKNLVQDNTLQSIDLFDRDYLKSYILNACQGPVGGLRDKPGKSVDFYHTCYVLSGLSLLQYYYFMDTTIPFPISNQSETKLGLKGCLWKAESSKSDSNLKDTTHLVATHPIFNIPIEKVINAYKFYWAI